MDYTKLPLQKDYTDTKQYWYDYYVYQFLQGVKAGTALDALLAIFAKQVPAGDSDADRWNALLLAAEDLDIKHTLQPRVIGDDFHFTGERSGRMLAMVPGYPNWFPQLQLTEAGRFCFYNYPKFFGITYGVNYIDINTGTNAFGAPGGSYDNVIGDTSKGATGGWGAGSSALATRLGWNDTASLGVVYGLQVIPRDKKLAQEFILAGRPKDVNRGNGGYPSSAHEFYSPITREWIVSRNGVFYYAAPFWWKVIWIQVQYYLDMFLTVPYNIFDLVPYGYSYPQFMLQIFDDKYRDDHLKGFLSNVDFFVAPQGKIKFWDYVLLAAPLLITAAATIISAGAGTPALVAALASLEGSVTLKEALKNIKKAQAVTDAQKDYNDLLEDNQHNVTDTPQPPIFEDQKNTWLLVAAGIVGIFLLTNKKKRNGK